MGQVTVKRFGSSGGGADRYLAVSLGDRRFGLHLDAVREIRAVTRMDAAEDRPSHVRGRIDVRGELVDVADGAELLGLGPWVHQPGSSLVILRSGAERVALLVDRALEIVEVPEARVAPRPEGWEGPAAQFVVGVATVAEGPLVLLDVGRLVRSVRTG